MPAINDLNDNQLIGLLNEGNREAFTEIYQRYAESLAGFAASKLYSLDDAKDVLHDLFTNLWTDRQELIITGSLQSYLFSAIRYRIVDKIRRNVTRQEYSAMLQVLEQQYAPDTDQMLQVKELQNTVTESLKALPAKTQHIYHLSRNEHHTIAEIAQVLNLSEQTVKNQLSIAL
ncbi:MAG: sigma-70 family RNA polymerase sigma factor, partial [Sphingobacteriaceae bacterium]